MRNHLIAAKSPGEKLRLVGIAHPCKREAGSANTSAFALWAVSEPLDVIRSAPRRIAIALTYRNFRLLSMGLSHPALAHGCKRWRRPG